MHGERSGSIVRLGVVVALAASSLLLAPAASDGAPLMKAPGRIAYLRDGGTAIWTARPNGADQRFVANGTSPTWSPDGERLAFELTAAATTYVAVVKPDGSDLVIRRGTAPVWSPDGRYLAFVRRSPISPTQLLRMRPDGRSVLSLGEGSDPSWSPDGTQLAFLRGFEVWTADADGSDPEQITETAPPGSQQGDVGAVSWSPDGAQIAYLRSTAAPDGGLYVVAPDGSEPMRIAAQAGEFALRELAWSPDSSVLAFVAVTDGDCFGVNQLEVVDRDGSGRRRVGSMSIGIGDPQFSPDGSTILASLLIIDEPLPSCDYESHSELGVIPVGGGDPVPGTWRLIGLLGSEPDWQAVPCEIVGTEGNDALTGTAADDVICGAGGDDTIAGLGGDDTIVGGTGTDTVDLSGSPFGADVQLTQMRAAGDGLDAVVSVEGVLGSSFADDLVGDAGPNMLSGAAGSDLLDGGGGSDLVSGGPGSDVVEIPRGDVSEPGTLDGGDGVDLARMRGVNALDLVAGTAGYSNVLMWHVVGFEEINGSPFGDAITGDEARNVISSMGGRDRVTGLGGDDLLVGGAEDDVIGGGRGRDTCIGGPGDDVLRGCEAP